jgi:methionine-rich copper-binding protein CopC
MNTIRTFASIVLISILGLIYSPQASGHVEIINAFPEQYGNTNPIPSEVWIEFSGNLQTLDGEAVNSIEVIDSTGLAVNYEDPIIAGGKITTKISGQSAAGVFTVKYRVVGEDGHVIEGEYTFNASPDYAEGQSPMPISSAPEESSIPAGGILLGALLIIFFGGIYMRAKKRST